VSITAIDLLSFSFGHVPMVPASTVYPLPEIYARLPAPGDSPYRIASLDVTSPANVEVVLGLETPAGYDFATRTQYRLMKPLMRGDHPQLLLGFEASKIVNARDRRLDLMNVRFLLATTYNESAALLGAEPERFRLVAAKGSVRLFENLQVLPRAFLVPAEGVVQAGETEALRTISEAGFDPLHEAVTHGLPTWSPLPGPPAESGSPGTVERIHVGVNFVSLATQVRRPSLLVLSDLYYPGWVAEVDGRGTQVLRTDFAFRGIALEPGHHSVKFSYRPPSFFVGLAVSIVSLAIWLALALRRSARQA
jgi:hypothetical protein